jgi:hypothetical protein
MDMTVISGTITLNDANWWTLAGQTLVIAEDAKFVVPAGKNINVQGAVIVNGTAVTEGTVTLYNANATVEAAAGLNVVTQLAGKKVTYVDGVYKVIDEDLVAYNPVTGEQFESVQAALNAAAKGETVKLLSDTTEAMLVVGAGKALDLNGYTLTADLIAASFEGSTIIDGSNGKGLLKIEKNSLSLSEKNPQLPLWYAEGVRFVEVSFGQKVTYHEDKDGNEGNKAYYRFAFEQTALETILDEYLATGISTNGISIRVKASWQTANGTVCQYFTFSDELVQAYLNGWDTLAFRLYLTGVAGLDITFSAEIVSAASAQTTVIIPSETIA